MVKAEKSEMQLEVLIATTNKTSLNFLDNMFCNCEISQFRILIVNQSSLPDRLYSNKSNIRVLNVTDFGITKSRNLALKHAKEDICLFTDDDVVFKKDFQKTIVKAFQKFEDAGLIAFKAQNLKGQDYRNYYNENKRFDFKSIKGLMSIEIAVRKKMILDKNIFFNERFGLGSEFETGEEYIFGRDILKNNISAYFFNSHIVSHADFNSGKDLGSDKIVYARAALNYSLYKNLVYLWIVKYMCFLLKNKYISRNQIIDKSKIALSGIKAYKKEMSV